MDVSEAKRLRALEEENRRLKTMVADLMLDNYNRERPHSSLGYLRPKAFADTVRTPKQQTVQGKATAQAPSFGSFVCCSCRHSFLKSSIYRGQVNLHTASLYDYFAKWDVLYKVNVDGARNIAELAIEHGAGRFVHWSTDGVYGEPRKLPGDENCPYDHPPNDYSKSKMQQEKLLWKLFNENGLPLTIIRPAPVYGPRHRCGTYHILYGMKKIGTGVIVSWYPKRKTLMMPSVHVTDLVHAALFVSDKEQAVEWIRN